MDLIVSLFQIIVICIALAGMWQTFVKAGQPGWGIFIPIYNVYLTIKIAGRPGWWLLLFLVPIVNIVILFIVEFDFAKSFGKNWAYGLGLTFLPFIFYPLIGFGDAQYRG